MNTYVTALNLVKLNLIKKNKVFFMKQTRKTYFLLNLLLKYNLILGYKKITIIKQNYFLIYLNSNYNSINLKNCFNKKNSYSIKLKTIRLLKNKKTYTKYILSTSKGLLSLNDAIKEQCGGVLLFKLF